MKYTAGRIDIRIDTSRMKYCQPQTSSKSKWNVLSLPGDGHN